MADSKAAQRGVGEEARSFIEQQTALFGKMVDLGPRATKRAPADASRRVDDRGEASGLSARVALMTEPWSSTTTLEALDQMICSCQKCPLGRTRTKFVFGVGNPEADIVVIGEAPGADEDTQGKPFVGAAGQLLNKILAAIDLGRDDVYICNILKCRPPGNRAPERFEVEQCEPYLIKQLDLIRPRYILALGLTAATTLLSRKAKMGEFRGKVHDYNGVGVIVTYHPAALLRNPQWKRSAWEDVQLLRRLYDESRSDGPVSTSS